MEKYFIMGVNKGASVTLELKYDLEDKRDDFNIDANLKTLFNGYGVDKGASLEFKKQLEKNTLFLI